MAVFCSEKGGPSLYLDCKECGQSYPSCANDTFFCLVAGSRTFGDREKLFTALDRLLVNHAPHIVIVHGGAKGADMLAGRYAEERGYQQTVFPVSSEKWKRYGKKAGYLRNREMHAFIAGFPKRGCVLFWDGVSNGTRQSIELAKEFGTPVRLIRF